MKKVCEMLAWYKMLYYLCNREREKRTLHDSKFDHKTDTIMKALDNWKNGVNEIRARLEAIKTRSCWDRGVKGFALNLLRSYIDICEYCDNNGRPVPELNEATLLNGAADWREYCEGGCALIYDADIACELCTPSELKKTDNGNKAPNTRETWMNVQARAYSQAYIMLINNA